MTVGRSPGGAGALPHLWAAGSKTAVARWHPQVPVEARVEARCLRQDPHGQPPLGWCSLGLRAVRAVAGRQGPAACSPALRKVARLTTLEGSTGDPHDTPPPQLADSSRNNGEGDPGPRPCPQSAATGKPAPDTSWGGQREEHLPKDTWPLPPGSGGGGHLPGRQRPAPVTPELTVGVECPAAEPRSRGGHGTEASVAPSPLGPST